LLMMRSVGVLGLEMMTPRSTSSSMVNQEEEKVPPRNLCPSLLLLT
jgi:hypothetical protein